MSETVIKPIELSRLLFDRKNPRLVEFDLSPKASDQEIIRILWETMDVRELVQSIAASGFFEHESLLVVASNNLYTVIEGNRRLAAVKLLLDPSLKPFPEVNIPCIAGSLRKKLSQLPSLVVTSRDEAWRYLGFKHVNGPAKWSSFAKAQYIADVHRRVEVDLGDIAEQIGDTHRTVYRLYRGLVVLEQAERLRVFKKGDRWKKHFSFSHLYTGLDYQGIQSFLGLREEVDDATDFVPKDKKGELGELFLWLYGSKKNDKAPIVKSQNPDLRRLDAVLNNIESRAALRNGYSLDYAFKASQPASRRFSEALQRSKADLESARALLSEGYDDTPQLLSMAKAVRNLACDLYDEMIRRGSSSSGEQISETR